MLMQIGAFKSEPGGSDINEVQTDEAAQRLGLNKSMFAYCSQSLHGKQRRLTFSQMDQRFLDETAAARSAVTHFHLCL